ncbi:MAG: hypothetical protein HQ509_02290 [Candidatus Marinimicrobia bacterium]|nr:hypothetical protein [Candidatus Neomarinimicrobiota bacterium]
MCGLAGIILGNKVRSEDDFEWIKQSMTSLLIRSQARGPHATGIAVIRKDGTYQLLKRPLPTEDFVETEEFQNVMAEIPARQRDVGGDSEVTIIMGHTRYRTIGTEKKSENNHPIRAGKIIGTHNGTIYNAPHIAKMYGLNRFADVDSEVLFRVANKFKNPIHFKPKLKDFRGQMTAVMVNLNSPYKIRIYKGNRPFAMQWFDELDTMIYASNSDYFESVESEGFTSHDYRFKPNRLIHFNTEIELKMKVSNFKFKPEVRKRCQNYLFTEL